MFWKDAPLLHELALNDVVLNASYVAGVKGIWEGVEDVQRRYMQSSLMSVPKRLYTIELTSAS